MPAQVEEPLLRRLISNCSLDSIASETFLKCYGTRAVKDVLSHGLQVTLCYNNIPSALARRRDTKGIWHIVMTVSSKCRVHDTQSSQDAVTIGLCSGIWVFTKYLGFSLG